MASIERKLWNCCLIFFYENVLINCSYIVLVDNAFKYNIKIV